MESGRARRGAARWAARHSTVARDAPLTVGGIDVDGDDLGLIVDEDAGGVDDEDDLAAVEGALALVVVDLVGVDAVVRQVVEEDGAQLIGVRQQVVEGGLGDLGELRAGQKEQCGGGVVG